jgi:hypothetical protein
MDLARGAVAENSGSAVNEMGDMEEEASEFGSESSDDENVREMSAGLRSALDSEISRLAGVGLPDAVAVAQAQSSALQHVRENRVHSLADSGCQRMQKSLRFECSMLQRSSCVKTKMISRCC